MEDLKHLREVLTEAYPREELSLDALARVVAALDGLPAAALDGGWTFKGFTAWAQALEKDAARYRWLAGNGWAEPAIYATGPREWGANGVALLAGPHLDAVIDGAISEAKAVGDA